MKIKLIYYIIVGYILLPQVLSFSQSDHVDVGIDEKLGSYIPLDLKFCNSDGDTVTLDQVINKPVLFALVYYECPGICSPLLTELAWVINKVDLKPIDDFEVVTLSFDHHETHEVAAKWKKSYFEGMNGEFPEEAWTFLTGDSVNIRKLTDAVGFYFKPDDEQFLHAATVIAISPDGKISRYLFGLSFNPFDIKMALLEAEAGKTNPTITKVLQFCFSYDPQGRSYVLNLTRIFGVLILGGVTVFLMVLVIKKKKTNMKKEQ